MFIVQIHQPTPFLRSGSILTLCTMFAFFHIIRVSDSEDSGGEQFTSSHFSLRLSSTSTAPWILTVLFRPSLPVAVRRTSCLYGWQFRVDRVVTQFVPPNGNPHGITHVIQPNICSMCMKHADGVSASGEYHMMISATKEQTWHSGACQGSDEDKS